MEVFDWYTWVGLPLLIFVSRIADVTLGTLRIIFTSRGQRNIAPVLGFVEILIWIIIVSEVIGNVQSLPAYIGYAAGFAIGTFVGMLIEDRMAMGTLVMRIILAEGADELAAALRAAGFGVTSVDGQGAQGPVKLLYTVAQRKNMPVVLSIIREVSPGAFYAVEEVRSTEMGIFPRAQVANAAIKGGKRK